MILNDGLSFKKQCKDLGKRGTLLLKLCQVDLLKSRFAIKTFFSNFQNFPPAIQLNLNQAQVIPIKLSLLTLRNQ
jgi:hypothetical protein